MLDTPPALVRRAAVPLRDLGGRFSLVKPHFPRPPRGVRVVDQSPPSFKPDVKAAGLLPKAPPSPFGPLGHVEMTLAQTAAGQPDLEEAFRRYAPVSGIPEQSFGGYQELTGNSPLLLLMRHPQTAEAARAYYDRTTNFPARYGLAPQAPAQAPAAKPAPKAVPSVFTRLRNWVTGNSGGRS
jgi:hypothetical protein